MGVRSILSWFYFPTAQNFISAPRKGQISIVLSIENLRIYLMVLEISIKNNISLWKVPESQIFFSNIIICKPRIACLNKSGHLISLSLSFLFFLKMWPLIMICAHILKCLPYLGSYTDKNRPRLYIFYPKIPSLTALLSLSQEYISEWKQEGVILLSRDKFPFYYYF